MTDIWWWCGGDDHDDAINIVWLNCKDIGGGDKNNQCDGVQLSMIYNEVN